MLSSGSGDNRQILPVAGWDNEVRYEVLLAVPEVRDRLAKCRGRATKSMTGEEWLGLYDKAFNPIPGVSLKTVASVVAPIYAKLGVRTGKTRAEDLHQPIGSTIVDVLCALAESGLPLNEVHQGETGCVIEASLPSDLLSFEGRLVITVERTTSGTRVEAATNIPGQWFDWGKSSRCLESLFGRLHQKAA